MNIFNRRLSRHCLLPSCVLITGDRGAGKSTLFALIIRAAKKEGLKCYSQYPYRDCYKLPMKKKIVNGVERYDIDKQYIYSHDFSDCVILLDEVKTIWHARDYKNWSADDEEFFNFIRKNDIRLFMATQAYDSVDLNVRRASDECWYLTKGILHFTHVEASKTTNAKVADRNTEVMGRMFKKGMRKIVWECVEVPIGNYIFWRKSFYKDFFTYFTYAKKKPVIDVSWNDDDLFN